MELVNPYDKCLVAVKNQDGNLVSHAPKELSKFFQKFLNDSGEREAECIGNRLNAEKGKGVEIPVDYRLVANEVRDGQKAFFDISRVPYLQILEELFEW
ncbi:unnamed protein product [Pocillopora meandrina]|uniref:Uncharacterized protein n=1 Tax=Pocillopora meandrina TaxID=46732 RepID=A0AAU9X1Z4_9CNID|nr:unnamed protein product [Pocillopora meandrina]